MKAKFTLKKILSWAFGWPAFLLAVSDYEDLRMWWVPFAAIITLIAIGWWNGAFND